MIPKKIVLKLDILIKSDSSFEAFQLGIPIDEKEEIETSTQSPFSVDLMYLQSYAPYRGDENITLIGVGGLTFMTPVNYDVFRKVIAWCYDTMSNFTSVSFAEFNIYDVIKRITK